MHPVLIDEFLQKMTIIIDTREHATLQAERRWADFNLPVLHKKLDFGDYSAFFQDDSIFLNLADKCVIERKMSLDELATCFTKGRKRFAAEFERAKEAGAVIILLIEKASWEKILSGQYKSKIKPESFLASLATWIIRYKSPVIFCKPETTPKIIVELLRKYAREILKNKQE